MRYWVVSLFLALASPSLAVEAEKFDEVLATCAEKCSGSWRGIDYQMWRLGGSYTIRETGVKWTQACRTDEFTDRKSCILSWDRPYDPVNRYRPYVHIIWTNISRPSIGVASLEEKYPGSLEQLRVDGGIIHSVREDGLFNEAEAINILASMIQAKSLRLRYTSWPDSLPRNSEVSLTSFKDVMDADAAFRRKFFD
jgi:hypothetical protein